MPTDVSTVAATTIDTEIKNGKYEKHRCMQDGKVAHYQR